MSEAKTIAEIEQAIAPIDAAIAPIAKRGLDTSQPGWLARWRDQQAKAKSEAINREPWRPVLERIGMQAEASALLADILAFYAGGSDADRAAIRALFHKYDSFCWAVYVPHEPMTEEAFRNTLILFSIKDQERDWRDAIVWLDGLCAEAGRAGLPRAKMLREAAALSSDEPHYAGWRTTRKMLLDYAARFGEP
jgi:hypothetical protein